LVWRLGGLVRISVSEETPPQRNLSLKKNALSESDGRHRPCIEIAKFRRDIWNRELVLIMTTKTSTHASYRWIIVAVGGLLGCIAIGTMFALPVLLLPMTEDTGWSRTGISAAMTIAFLSMAPSNIAWGAISDRVGPRIVALAGSILLAISLYSAGRASSLLLFQVIFGLLLGCSMAAFFAPMMATVTGWFETHRSLAVSLVSAGMGMAPFTMSPLVAWLIANHDWRTVFTILAAIVAIVMIPASLLLRQPPGFETSGSMLRAEAEADDDQRDITVGQALRSPQFLILFLANFCCCATHSGPIFHTVSYAIHCGIPALAAVSIYSIEGLAGMGGRVGFGILGDKFGAKRVLAVGLLIQAVGALGYFFANNLAAFYAVATLFGFVYAGTMPLYAVLLRENFPLRMLGTIMGGTSMAGSLGMATGPLLGGWIFDTTGDYGWLYISSFGMGLGALFIILTFRPFPKESRRAAGITASMAAS
jgi:MFS family permease